MTMLVIYRPETRKGRVGRATAGIADYFPTNTWRSPAVSDPSEQDRRQKWLLDAVVLEERARQLKCQQC